MVDSPYLHMVMGAVGGVLLSWIVGMVRRIISRKMVDVGANPN